MQPPREMTWRIRLSRWLLLPLLLTATHAASPGRMLNFSARAEVGPDADALIAGFALTGPGERSILVRGVGPTLGQFGVSGFLPDPVVTVFSGSAVQRTNDDWWQANDAVQLAALAPRFGAFALPDRSADAMLLSSLPAGGYAAHVTGKANRSGVALIEVYDTSSAGGATLANFSARARAGAGAASLIAGFVIAGGGPQPMLIRGIGPALAAFGVATPLADPVLALFRQGATTPLLENSDWGGGDFLRAAGAASGAFPLSPTGKDAAMLVMLDPGAYTVQLSSLGRTAGVGLVELYPLTAEATPAPTLAAPPASLAVPRGTSTSLTAIAHSFTPLSYQWYKDGGLLAGETAGTLSFPRVQPAQAGAYTVTVTNAAGAVTSPPATLALLPAPTGLPPAHTFNLVGFATVGNGTSGGGVLAPGDANYRVLDAAIPNPAQQLRAWLESSTALVVDVQVDIDLGALNNVANRPRTNPELIASGLGTINVRSNKTLFSSTGATLRHGLLNLSGQSNIIIRNLRFRGLWEFDEGSQNAPDNSPWGYKIQDWDYLTIQNNARNIWIDHCDFEKSYDGLADTKNGADLVTFSWCRFGGDTEGAVARQISYLERIYQGQIIDPRINATFYRGLRDGRYAAQGIPAQSVQDIINHELPHDKCNLVGASDTTTSDNGTLNVTFHHLYYHDCRQRLPRMRFGNAHVYNILVDNSRITTGTNMATATTTHAAVFAENNVYREVAEPFPAQSGTSPAGRIAQTGCAWILQGAVRSLAANSFLQDPATWTWNTATRNFSWTTAPAPNAARLPYSYQADPADYTANHLSHVGVILPSSPDEQATLARYLVRTAQLPPDQ